MAAAAAAAPAMSSAPLLDVSAQQVKYVGFVQVNNVKGKEQIDAAILALVDDHYASFVPVLDYVDAQLHLEIQSPNLRIVAANNPTGPALVEFPVRGISYFGRGLKGTKRAQCFGFITDNRISDMHVGYICHVVKTPSSQMAEDLMRSVAHSLTLITGRHRSVSGSSGLSGRSHDSGFSSSPSTHLPNPLRMSPIPPQRRRTHRRAQSDGAVAKTIRGSRNSYMVAQTAENLQRRLLAMKPPILQRHEFNTRTFSDCIPGQRLVSWMVAQGDFPERAAAVSCLQTLQDAGALQRLSPAPRAAFTDDAVMVRFPAVQSALAAPSDELVSSVDSLDEERLGFSTQDLCGSPLSESGLDEAHAHSEEELAMLRTDNLTAMKGIFAGDNPPTDWAQTLFGLCVQHNAVDCAQYLLVEQGVNVNYPSKLQQTPLHKAAILGHPKMVSILVGHGAAINAQDKQGSTALLRAAGRLKNLECVIRLVECAAQLDIANSEGVKAIDLIPDLGETQRRLCESSISEFVGSRNVDSLKIAVRFASNPETASTLIAKIREPAATAALCEACEAEEACAVMVARLIRCLFPSGKKRAHAADLGMLKTIVPLCACPEPAGSVAIQVLTALLNSANHDKDYSYAMSKLPVAPLLQALVKHSPAEVRNVLLVLAHVTLHPVGRDNVFAPHAIKVLGGILAKAIANPDAKTTLRTLEYCLQTIANLGQDPKHVPALRKAFLKQIRVLLKHDKNRVRSQAVRAALFLGERELFGYSLFLYGNLDSPQNLWGIPDKRATAELFAGVRGVSLEKAVDLATSFEGDVCPILFRVFQYFYHPVSIFRLILHKLNSVPVSADTDLLPDAHHKVLNLLKMWMENSFSDFLENQIMLKELKVLLARLLQSGPAYEAAASRMLQMAVTPELREMEPSGVRDYSQALHETLYLEVQEQILSGMTPCTLDVAVHLAALQILIEELSKTKPLLDNPQFKIKAVMPADFVKAKEVSKQIVSAYHGICHLSDRDAKHEYIIQCQRLVSEGCSYFHVKRVFPNAKGKKVPCLLGVGESISVLDIKTKAVQQRCEWRFLRRWDTVVLGNKGKDKFKPVPAGKGTPHLVMCFKDTDLLFVGDEGVFSAISNAIWRQIETIEDRKMSVSIPSSPDMRRAAGAGGPGGAASTPAKKGFARTASTPSPVTPGAPRRARAGSAPGVEAHGSLRVPGPHPDAPGSPGHGELERTPQPSNAASVDPSPSHTPTESPISSLAHTPPALRRARLAGEPMASGSPPRVTAAAVSSRLAAGGAANRPRTSSGASSASSASSSSGLARGGSGAGRGRAAPASPRTQAKFGAVGNTPSWSNAGERLHETQPRPLLRCNCPEKPAIGELDITNLTAHQVMEHPLELARQLTLVEHERFKIISPRDCLAKAVKPQLRGGPSLGAVTTKTVDGFVAWFNRVSQWVATVVLGEENRLARALLLERWIKTARHCLELNNFNGVMEIVSALGSSGVRRITETWELLGEETMAEFHRLEHLMLADDNFKAYRDALAKAAPPAVPYFGIYLRDLTFLQHGNPDYVRGGLLNIYKWRLIVKQLRDMAHLQSGNYNVLIVQEFREFLLSITPLDDDTLHQKSKAIRSSRAQSTSKRMSMRIRRRNSAAD